MTSEIRANTLKNRVGLGTVSFTNTGPVVSGIVTANTFRLSDNTSGSVGRLQIGNGLDLSLFHDGTNSFLVNNTGYLSIQSQDGVNGIFIARNAEVNLYYGSSVRMQTSSAGITVNRDLDVDGHTNLDNVSIAGVTTMSSHLHVSGTTNLSAELRANANIRMTNAGPKITFVDDNHNPDYEVGNLDGVFRIRDATSSVNRLTVNSTGVSITNNLDVDGHTNLDNVSVAGVSTFTGITNFDNGAVNIINGGGAYQTHLNYNDTGINFITSTNAGGTYFRGSNNNVTTMAVQGSGPVDIDGDLRHLGDTDTMLQFGTDTISLKTAGTDRLSISSDGQFNFNHGSVGRSYNFNGPSADNNWGGYLKLHSYNGTTVQAEIRTSTTGMLFGVGGSERLRIASNGQITQTAASGDTIITLKRSNTNTTGTVGAINFAASDGHSVASIQARGDGDNEGAHLQFYTTTAAAGDMYNAASVERLRITSNGKVNIGTGNLNQTDRMLNVYGGRVRIEGITSGNSFEIYASNTTGQSYGILCQAGTNSTDYNSTYRNTSGTTLFRILGDGKVLVGRDSASHTSSKMEIRGGNETYVRVATNNTTGSAGIIFGSSDDHSTGGIYYNNSDDSLVLAGYNNDEKFRITSYGDVYSVNSAYNTYDNAATSVNTIVEANENRSGVYWLNFNGQKFRAYVKANWLQGRNWVLAAKYFDVQDMPSGSDLWTNDTYVNESDFNLYGGIMSKYRSWRYFSFNRLAMQMGNRIPPIMQFNSNQTLYGAFSGGLATNGGGVTADSTDPAMSGSSVRYHDSINYAGPDFHDVGGSEDRMQSYGLNKWANNSTNSTSGNNQGSENYYKSHRIIPGGSQNSGYSLDIESVKGFRLTIEDSHPNLTGVKSVGRAGAWIGCPLDEGSSQQGAQSSNNGSDSGFGMGFCTGNYARTGTAGYAEWGLGNSCVNTLPAYIWLSID